MLASLFSTVILSASAEDGENVLPDKWKSYTEDFSDFNINDMKAGSSGKGALRGTVKTGTSEIITNGNESYLKVAPGRNEKLWFDIESEYYTLSFDFFMHANTTSWYGLYLLAGTINGGEINGWKWFLLNNAVRPGCQTNDCITENVGANVFNNGQANTDTWLTVRYVCNGDTMSLLIQNRETGTVLYDKSYTWTCDHGSGIKTPMLNFAQPADAADVWYYFDNIRFRNTTGDLDVVGVQSSAIADGEYAVRFVGTVNTTEYEKVGFEVVASYLENGVAKERTFTVDTCEVYTSILASNGNGVYSVTAKELGGKYLIALSITGIPASLGEVTFSVHSFAKMPDSEDMVKSETAAITATNDGSTVTLKVPDSE